MDTLLTFLKFGGIILSGVLGILTTLTYTHEDGGLGGKKRLNRWGKWAFTFTVAGFLIAFGAQLAEVLKKRSEDAESRKRTEEQIKQANEVLVRLEQQGRQSTAILTNVEQQGVIAKKSLDALSLQSTQTRALLTDVEVQGVLAKQSLNTLSTQAVQTALVLTELKHQGSLVEESQKRGEQQVETANLSLRYLERVVTPIDLITVSALYDVPTNAPWAMRILQLIAPATTKAQQAIMKSPPKLPSPGMLTNLSNQLREMGRFKLASRFVASTETYVTDDARPYSFVSGDINFPSDPDVTLFFDPHEPYFSVIGYGIPGVRYLLIGTNLETQIDLNRFTNRFETDRILMSLRSPDLNLDFTRRGGILNSDPDLKVINPRKVQNAVLVFSQRDGTLRLHWRYQSTAAERPKSQRIQSIPDLAGSTVRMQSRFPFSVMTPHIVALKQLSVYVGNSTITLTNFHGIPERDDTWVETTLPNRPDILAIDDLQK